jgi:hypothetical protein
MTPTTRSPRSILVVIDAILPVLRGNAPAIAKGVESFRAEATFSPLDAMPGVWLRLCDYLTARMPRPDGGPLWARFVSDVVERRIEVG